MSSPSTRPVVLVMDDKPSDHPITHSQCSVCRWCGRQVSWQPAIPCACGTTTTAVGTGVALSTMICCPISPMWALATVGVTGLASCAIHGYSSGMIHYQMPGMNVRRTAGQIETATNELSALGDDLTIQADRVDRAAHGYGSHLEREAEQDTRRAALLTASGGELRAFSQETDRQIKEARAAVGESRNLIKDVADLVKALHPKRVVKENVDALSQQLNVLCRVGEKGSVCAQRAAEQADAHLQIDKDLQRLLSKVEKTQTALLKQVTDKDHRITDLTQRLAESVRVVKQLEGDSSSLHERHEQVAEELRQLREYLKLPGVQEAARAALAKQKK